MRYMFAVLVALPLAAVAACASFASATVPKSAVFYFDSVFTAAEGTATVYVSAPPCKAGQTFLKNGCSTDAGVAKIDPLVKVARKAADDLDQFYAAHKDGIGITGVYDAAIKAYNDLEAGLKAVGAVSKVSSVMEGH